MICGNRLNYWWKRKPKNGLERKLILEQGRNKNCSYLKEGLESKGKISNEKENKERKYCTGEKKMLPSTATTL